MKKAIQKLKEIREHKYFTLYAVLGLIILIVAAYLTFLNHSNLTVIVKDPETKILVDGRMVEDAKIVKQKRIIRLFPGTHTVRIQAPNMVEYAQTITLFRGIPKTINPALKMIPDVSPKASQDARFLTASPKKDTVYYLSENSIYKHNLKTNTRTALSTGELNQVLNIAWSPDYKLMIIEKADGFYLYDFNYYDLTDPEVVFLGSHQEMTMPAWDPTLKHKGPVLGATTIDKPSINRRIAYLKKSQNNFELFFANQLNKNPDHAASLANLGNANLIWSPDGKFIAIYSDRGLYLFNIFTRQLDFKIENQSITGVKFSPNSESLIFISDRLYYIRTDGQGIKDLASPTEVERVVWGSNSNYITIAEANSSTGLDDIYKIDVRSSETIKYLYNSEERLIITRMVLGSLEDVLIFQSNNRLYSLFLQTEE